MNALVIGGTGFIGFHCCNLLSAAGFNVVAYSPSAHSIPENDNLKGVSGHIENYEDTLRWVNWADIVFHFAGTVLPRKNVPDPKMEIETSLSPLISLLEMLKINPSKKIVFCSTGGAIYGNLKSKPFKETDPKSPLNHYGNVKALMEERILKYHKTYQIPFIILRPSNVYGPKFNAISKQGIISTLLHNGLQSIKTEIWDPPGNIRDFIFIEDFGRALLTLLNSNAEGIFNIGSGKGYSITEIIDKVQSLLKENLILDFLSDKMEKPTASILDISHIHAVTGWKPEISLEMGIARTFNSLIEKSSLRGKAAV